MQRILVVRHGDYDTEENLSNLGRQQITRLATKIKADYCNSGESVCILSSTAPRAYQSAEILGYSLNAPVACTQVLLSFGTRGPDCAGATDLIKANSSCDVIIIVTHLEFTWDLPQYLARNGLVQKVYGRGEVQRGEMVVLDCISSTATSADNHSNSTAGSTIASTDQNLARRYAQQLFLFTDKKSLLHVYLFGSVATRGHGRDIDLILEVPKRMFLFFAKECIGTFDGFHPIEKVLLQWASMYWSYYSPERARFENALKTIGLTESQIAVLDEIVPSARIDLLCLPTTWNKEGHVNRLLRQQFGLGGDPNILTNISNSCIELPRQV